MMMFNFRTPAVMAFTGVAAFSLVMGAAASLLVDTDDLGAGTIDVASCDADGVDVEYVTSPVESDAPADADATPGPLSTDTDSLDPATASVGTPTFYVTHVLVTGIADACADQGIEVSLYCDANITNHHTAGDTAQGSFEDDEAGGCPDGDSRFRFLSSNNSNGDGSNPSPTQLVVVPNGDSDANTAMIDVTDVEAAFVDQVSVIVTGEENDAVAAPAGVQLAVAWTNLDGAAGYQPGGDDVLVAEFVDMNTDCVFNVGDEVRTYRYPTDVSYSSFESFQTTSHTIDRLGGTGATDMWGYFEDGGVDSGSVQISLAGSSREMYWERGIVNGNNVFSYWEDRPDHDRVQISQDSPSHPTSSLGFTLSSDAPNNIIDTAFTACTN